jgi:hypothetical protein
MYNFIHCTKSGGTAFNECIIRNYSNYIKGNNHSVLCENNNNPIIIFRNPIDRFISMYKYWRNGSNKWGFKQNRLELNKNITIKDYINFIKCNDKTLMTSYTNDLHYKPTSYWINNTEYKNLIIITYDNDLNIKLRRLLRHLNIPKLNVSVEKVNVSINDENIILDKEEIKFIKTYFSEDFKLMNFIVNKPEVFKMVI